MDLRGFGMNADTQDGRFDGIFKLVHVDAVFTVEVVEKDN